MGAVYLAEDPVLERRVAIKVLRPCHRGGGDERRALERLRAEARAVASLNHPNVVTLHALEQHDGQLVLVMEALEGQTLSRRLSQGPIAATEIMNIAVGLARALEAAHARGVVHRDLKPGNIMLCPNGGLKVLDFGLAVMTRSSERPAGSPGYVAPEQWRGAPAEATMDLYSLGVVLTELLLGHSAVTRLQRDRSGWISRELRKAVPGLPTPVVDLVESCLSLDPESRPQSAAEVLSVLREAQESQVLRRHGGARRGRLWASSRIAVPLALIAVLVAGSGTDTARSGSSLDPNAGPVLDGGGADRSSRSSSTIAVWPFENLGPAEDEYFAAGLTEELTTLLASMRDMAVISTDSVRGLVESGATRTQIGRELGAEFLVLGSVRWQPSVGATPARVRITSAAPARCRPTTPVVAAERRRDRPHPRGSASHRTSAVEGSAHHTDRPRSVLGQRCRLVHSRYLGGGLPQLPSRPLPSRARLLTGVRPRRGRESGTKRR